ncbi:MAG: PASTA domain-containing protein [Calditrichota bacterium]
MNPDRKKTYPSFSLEKPFSSARNWINRRFSRPAIEIITGLLVLLGAGIWILGIFDKIIMPWAVGHQRTICVPDLIKLNFKQADSLCAALGLELIPTQQRVEDRLPRGTILDQYPAAGSITKPQRRIEVVVSAVQTLARCPEVRGCSPREAMLLADSAGLVIRTEHFRFRHSAEVPEGVVIDQSPPPQTGINRGSEIIITASLGASPEVLIVPNFIGRTLDEARLPLAKNNLILGEVISYPDKTAPPGQILWQSPSPGTIAEPGTRVDVRIAATPRQITTSDDDTSEKKNAQSDQE